MWIFIDFFFDWFFFFWLFDSRLIKSVIMHSIYIKRRADSFIRCDICHSYSKLGVRAIRSDALSWFSATESLHSSICPFHIVIYAILVLIYRDDATVARSISFLHELGSSELEACCVTFAVVSLFALVNDKIVVGET
jgi:hypothetical protein